jgi:hypothetical protein
VLASKPAGLLGLGPRFEHGCDILAQLRAAFRRISQEGFDDADKLEELIDNRQLQDGWY